MMEKCFLFKKFGFEETCKQDVFCKQQNAIKIGVVRYVGVFCVHQDTKLQNKVTNWQKEIEKIGDILSKACAHLFGPKLGF